MCPAFVDSCMMRKNKRVSCGRLGCGHTGAHLAENKFHADARVSKNLHYELPVDKMWPSKSLFYEETGYVSKEFWDALFD